MILHFPTSNKPFLLSTTQKINQTLTIILYALNNLWSRKNRTHRTTTPVIEHRSNKRRQTEEIFSSLQSVHGRTRGWFRPGPSPRAPPLALVGHSTPVALVAAGRVGSRVPFNLFWPNEMWNFPRRRHTDWREYFFDFFENWFFMVFWKLSDT